MRFMSRVGRVLSLLVCVIALLVAPGRSVAQAPSLPLDFSWLQATLRAVPDAPSLLARASGDRAHLPMTSVPLGISRDSLQRRLAASGQSTGDIRPDGDLRVRQHERGTVQDVVFHFDDTGVVGAHVEIAVRESMLVELFYALAGGVIRHTAALPRGEIQIARTGSPASPALRDTLSGDSLRLAVQWTAGVSPGDDTSIELAVFDGTVRMGLTTQAWRTERLRRQRRHPLVRG